MSSREFTYWMAKYRKDPFGTWRDNYHAGLVSAQLFNANRDPRRSSSVSATDFILRSAEEQKEIDTKKTVAMLRAMANTK